MFQQIIENYKNKVSCLQTTYEHSGQGAVRDATGVLFETLCDELMNLADPAAKPLKNDYKAVKSKSGYILHNLQVDRHVYKNDRLLAFVECKTYLDACFLKRAVEDFKMLLRVEPLAKCAIIAGQNAVSHNTMQFYRDELEFEVFFMNVDKKRSSTKPLWKSYNCLDTSEMSRFVEWASRTLAE